jgi:hypothetical protein
MYEIMKKGYAAILIIALLTASVLAEDMFNPQYIAVLCSAFAGTDGSCSGNVKICRTTPVGINFVNGNQRCRVEYRTVPPEIAERYGYDPAKVAEFETLLKRR